MKIGEYDFQYKSSGILRYDPGLNTKHYDPFWCIMELDPELCRYYSWFTNKEGVLINKPNVLWGFHVSVIKGEQPIVNSDKWRKDNGKIVEFLYGNYVSWSNGRHAWMNLYCEELSDLREYYGLHTNGKKLKYHMTLGSLKNPTSDKPEKEDVIYTKGDLHSI